MRRIAVLLSFLLAATAAPAAEPEKPFEGFVLKSPDGYWQVRLGGYADLDGRAVEREGRDSSSSFLARRARLTVSGKIGKAIEFRLMPDFGEGKTVLQDAYVDVRVSPRAVIRAGKTKAPFGQERLQSATDLALPERSLANNLVPNRDIGVMIRLESASRRTTLDAALMNGVPDGGSSDGDSDEGKELAARVASDVVKSDAGALRLALAATWGESDSAAMPSYKTPGQETFFSYLSGTRGDGARSRVSPQLVFTRGGLLVSVEGVASRHEVARGGVRETAGADGWQVTGRWVRGGTIAPGGKVTPGADGAWELAARASGLSVDDAVFGALADPATAARGATSAGMAVNWYPLAPLKLMLAAEQTRFDGGAPAGDRGDETTVTARMQIVF